MGISLGSLVATFAEPSGYTSTSYNLANGRLNPDTEGIDRYPGVRGHDLTLGSGDAARSLPSGPDLI